MRFHVTDRRIVKIEADRVTEMLTMRRLHSNDDGSPREWEDEEFAGVLQDLGLTYTSAQLRAIQGELMNRGIIEQGGIQ